MITNDVQSHIRSLSNDELVEYCSDSTSGYTPEAIAFACDEALSRGLTEAQLTTIRCNKVKAIELAEIEVKDRRDFIQSAPGRWARSGVGFGATALLLSMVVAPLFGNTFIWFGFLPWIIVPSLFGGIGYLIGLVHRQIAQNGS